MTDIFHRVGINAKPGKVFTALTTIEGLRSWWVVMADGSAEKGGSIDAVVFDMQVLEAQSDKLVHWKCTRGPKEWLDTEVIFRLEWKDGQTFVMFQHINFRYQDEFLFHSSTKWATFLLSLRDAVENGQGHPIPDDLKIYIGEGMVKAF